MQVETGSYADYATQTNDEQSAALVQSIAGRVGQTADAIEELWRARTPIIVGGIVFPILLAVAYMVLRPGFATHATGVLLQTSRITRTATRG